MMQLARALVGHGHAVIILTPNYGAAHEETIEGVSIQRFWFPRKMRVGRKMLRAWWHTSVFWWVWSAIAVFRAARRFHPDAIHIHGKFSLSSGVLVGRLLRIPTVFTARDYRALCNYGRCISERADSQRCSFREYWLWEFPAYAQEYTTMTLRAWLVNVIYAIRGRVWGSVLFFWVKRVDMVVCVSQAVARIYQANGITKTTSIYNIQPPFARGALENILIQKQALYIGKLTPGKGAGLLSAVIKKTIERHPDLHWIIFTNGGVLENQVKKELAYLTAQGMVEMRPYVPHDELVRHIGESMLVCIPSVWHEPLTRLALEALQSGTPVVITDRGGSREVVEDGVIGRLTPVDANAIADAVVDVVTQNDAYRAHIQEQQANFTNTFCVQPIEQHQALYESMVARRVPKRTLGVILPPGGSLTALDRHGQKSRFFSYLEQYARAFDRVFVFSYEQEVEPSLPPHVVLITPSHRISKRLYTFLLPLMQRHAFRACQVLRVMQMDGCIPAVIARALYGVPFVATYGYKYPEFVLLKGRHVLSFIMRVVEWIGVHAAHSIIYTTDELKRYLEQFGSVVMAKLRFIPNGVNVEQFAPGPSRDRHTLLFVGRLEEQKNLFALLEAVALLPERYALKLVWVGRGSLEAPLRERARELGINLNIVPRVDHTELSGYYANAGIFTLVSLIEGMPKALVEAMSAGCACLVSDCDGNRMVVEDGVNGLVVGTDAPSIAAGLGRLLQDPALCEKLGKSARECVLERYNLKELLAQEVELLREVESLI